MFDVDGMSASFGLPLSMATYLTMAFGFLRSENGVSLARISHMTTWSQQRESYSEGVNISLESVLLVVEDLGSHPMLESEEMPTNVPM